MADKKTSTSQSDKHNDTQQQSGKSSGTAKQNETQKDTSDKK